MSSCESRRHGALPSTATEMSGRGATRAANLATRTARNRRRSFLLLAATLLELVPSTVRMASPTRALATTDLAQGKTATASSTYNSNWVAGNAVDGNDATGWACATSGCAAGEWLQVDLGSAMSVGSVRVYMPTSSARAAWELQHSSDGSTWTYVLPDPGTSADVAKDFTHSINDRYWRLLSTTAAGGSGWEIYTFSLFDTGATAPSDGDLARDIKPTASSTYGSWFPSYATDGDDSTGWSCATSGCAAGEWLQPAPCSITTQRQVRSRG